MAERQIPNSLLEKYADERARCYKTLWLLDDAISALMSGNVSSYSLGNRSVSYQSLGDLRELKRETEAKIDELEALMSGRPARSVTVNTMLTPSICLPKKG